MVTDVVVGMFIVDAEASRKDDLIRFLYSEVVIFCWKSSNLVSNDNFLYSEERVVTECHGRLFFKHALTWIRHG